LRPRRLVVIGLWTIAAIALIALFALIRPATQNKKDFAANNNKSLGTDDRGTKAKGEKLNRWQKQYGTLPLSFEPNIGQTDALVKFVSRGRGYTLFLTPTEAVLALRRMEATGARKSIVGPGASAKVADAQNASSAVLRMKLIGANPGALVSGREKLPGKSNYFIGNDPKKWRSNVPTYASVSYQDVYPGVDLIHYGNQQQLEHDFIVRPGADPKAITLGFPSADKLTLDPKGNLLIDIGGEAVALEAPVIYQETAAGKKNIEGHYIFKGSQQIGFEVAAYDSSNALIIDPVLVYSTYLGGSTGNDQGNGIAVDSTGSAYIVGATASTNFPTTATAFQKTFNGGTTDVFVTKLNPTGSALVYSTYLGGTVGDAGMSIAVDNSGNAYITGQAGSNNFPTTAGVVQAAFGGGTSDAFVTKLNSTGSALTYSTYLGGSGLDVGMDIAIDSSGNAYVTGQTQSPNFSASATAFQKTLSGASDIFVSKLNSTGTALTYSTYLGGSANEISYAISVDSSGNAYIAGDSSSLNYPVSAGAVQATFGGGVSNAVVTKLNSTGSALIYSTYLGGSGTDVAHGLAVDSSGNAYVCGSTTSSNFPLTAGALQASFAGGTTNGDGFVTKLNAAGTALVYSTYLGGTGDDSCNALAINSAGNAFVTGFTKSSNFPTAGSPAQGSFGGNTDVFLSELNANGTSLLYSTYLGGSGDDEGTGIAMDSAGNPYITGFTNSSNFPTAGNRFQSSLAGGYDGFVAKFSFGNPFSFVQAKPSGSSFGAGTTTFSSPNIGGDTIIVGIDYGDPAGSITAVTDTAGNTYTKSCSVVVTSTAGHLEVWHAQNIRSAATNTVTVTPSGNLGLQWAIGEYAGPSTNGPIVDSCNGQLGSGGGTDNINSGNIATTNNDLIIGWGRVSGGSVSPGTNFSYGMAGVDGQLLEHRLGVAPTTLAATESDSSASHWGMIVVALLPGGPAPSVNLSASSLTFASQALNTTSTAQSVTLTNTGTAALNISGISVTGTNSGDYSQTNTCGSTVSANNGKCTINVTFKPTAAGTRTAAVTITDNGSGGQQTIALTGTGVAVPVVSLSTSSLTFPSQAVNTTSTAQTVTLTNTGTAALTVTSIGLTGANSAEYAQTNTCGTSVPANNGTCTISVTFTPTSLNPGTPIASVAITDNAAGSPQSINLSGTVTGAPAPIVTLSSASLTFASQITNTTSAAQTVTLTNTGNAVLNLSSIGVIGANSGDFADTTTCGATVAANNGTCTISVTFTPTATGTRTAAVSLTDNAAGNPQSITLSGTGAPNPGTVSIKPTSNNFGSIAVGSTSGTLDVSVNDIGSNSLSISSVVITGDFTMTNFCGSSLSPGFGCDVWVKFAPTAPGVRTGTIVFTDSSPDSPQVVTLTGTGTSSTAPVVSLSATSLTYASQQVNTTSGSQTVTLTNTGNAALNISSLAITGANSGDYAQTNTCGASVAANNGACTISVTFTPTVIGTRTAAVTITDNAAGSPHSITLSGTGTGAPAPVVSLSASTVTFASQVLNTTSGSQTVTLTNTGNAALNLTSIGLTGANGGDYAQTNTCGSIVAANNGSCTISVTFTPTATGTRTAAVTITDNATGSPQAINLTGTGAPVPAPVMSLSASSLTFASQQMNTTSGSQTVTLTNTGNATLNISSLGITGANSGDYAQTNTCGSTVAANNGTCTISVTFTPTAVGTRTAAVTITDNATGSPHSITLTGTGAAAPAASLSTSSLTFASQQTNTTSAAQPVTLTNTGNAVLNITSISVTGANSGDYAQTNTCGSSVAANNGTCTISVTFTPAATGTRTAAATLTDNATGSPQTITLTGTGTPPPAPVVSLSGSSLTFTNQQVNTTSPAQTVTLTNTGNAALNLTSIAVTGTNSGDYAQTNTCGSSVAANNGTCTISVTFTPTATGTRSASVSITDNATGSPQTITLSGTGTPAPAPVVSLSASSLTFTSQQVGTTSAAQTVTLTNTGNAALSITSIAVTGANSGDYAQSNTCGSSVTANNGTCTINVTFAPTAAGTRTASVTITDSAAGSPHAITFSGTGAASPVVNLSSTSLTFATQALGAASSPQSVTLTNSGNGPLTITSIAVTGANSGDFAQSNTCGGSVAANNGTCTITVTFTPTGAGVRAAAVTITDNAAGSPHSISLNGTGSASPVTITPPSNNYGSQAVGTSTHATIFTIKNVGSPSLTLNSITTTGDFSLTNFCGSGLSQGFSCDVWVIFTPTAPGVRTGSLVFTDSSPDSPQVVPLTGTGTSGTPAPAVNLAPSNLTFASQQVNTTSAAQPVTLTNTGTAALTITGISVTGANAGDYTQLNSCGGSVPANNGSCTITVTFTPTAAGTRAAAVTITDNAAGSPHSIPLSGTGASAPAPVVSLSSSSLTFASQTLNTTSGSQTVTLTNTGNAALNLTSIGLTGANTGDYAETTTCGSTVAANNGNCTISVTFTPTATGSRTAAVTITDNATGSPQTITLTGTGANANAPAVGLSTSSLTFASQTLNTTSASQTVTLTNTGNAVLNLSSIGLTGTNSSDYAETTTCGSTVAANNGNCTISVTFTPTATGSRTAAVTITDNATGSPQTITLTGTGANANAPAVGLSTSSLTFASQTLNTTSASQTVTLTNTGNAVLNLLSIGLTGTNSSDYAETTTCGSTVAANNGSCTISVTFTPAASGTRTAAVTITDNATGSPQTVALSGTGASAASTVVLTPTSFNFGTQTVGTTSGAADINIMNTGAAFLTLNSITVTGDFTLTNFCGGGLSTGYNCDVWVQFTPTATGVRTGTLIFNDSAPGSPHVVTLTGTGN